jgi:minor histocompatibility antigen H13
MASAIGIGIISSVTAANLVVPLPLVVNLLVFTLVPIFIGSMRSRKLSPVSSVKSNEPNEVTVIGSKEAMRFPVIAAGVLLTLYVTIKYISPDLVNLLISFYFLLIGAYCLKYYIHLQILDRNIIKSTWKYSKMISIPYLIPSPEVLEITLQDLVGYGISIPIALLYIVTKNWVLSNVFGIVLSIHAIENMPLGSFLVGFGLLGGLLVYDVFFVFGTDVMLTVAKNIDAPIKLLFPKPLQGFSMIGLGDIVLPGILVAMTLRYDLLRLHKRDQKGIHLYFISSMLGYAAGILLTFLAMVVMDKEQPALLYLVPCTIISVLLPALVTKELGQLWVYKEENSE